MKRFRSRPAAPCVAAALIALAFSFASTADVAVQPAELTCANVDIHRIGHSRLDAIKQRVGVEFWVEADDQLLVCGSPARLDQAVAGERVRLRFTGVERSRLAVLRRAHDSDLGVEGIRTLARGGRYALVEVLPGADLAAPWHAVHDPKSGPGPQPVGAALLPFRENAVLARQVANDPPRASLGADPGVQAIVDQIDPQRWLDTVTTLAAFETRPGTPDAEANRNTGGFDVGDPAYPGGIVAARDWIAQQLGDLGLAVSTPSFTVDRGFPFPQPWWTVTAYNVLGRLEGTERPDEWYIVGAHYDARNSNNNDWLDDPAPGAEDNGSGCAGVIELARIFAANPPETTMLFMCYSGEEQGLHGSEAHADSLVAGGEASKVQGMFNLDMIGFTGDGELDCEVETTAIGQPLMDDLVTAAGTYTSLVMVTSLSPCCSDHMPYLDSGMPAVLSIENDWNQYGGYHQSTDVVTNLSTDMGAEILRMNAAVLAQRTGAAPAGDDIFADGFESGDVTAWSAAVGG